MKVRCLKSEVWSQESGVRSLCSLFFVLCSLFLLIPAILFSAPHISGKYGCQEKAIISFLPKTGTISIIFLRVEFSDVKSNNQDFGRLMNNMGDYYQNVSFGKLNLVSTITQTFALTQTMTYYGNPENPTNLINDAIATATLNGINLSGYDSIMILHSGAGEETGDDHNQIYSTTLETISIIPEMENFGISPFGVWCHEFAHQLGLLDMNTVGPWSLMDIGCYNGNGEYPAYPDAYSRWRLGWINPIEITNLFLTLSSNNVYQLGGTLSDFFLVEKRGDQGLPGSGFLVWHINGNLTNLNKISLLQADGGNNIGDSGDTFPGTTRNFLLDDWTNPSLRYFDGNPSGFRIEILIPHPPKAKAFPNPIDLSKTKRVFFEVERGSNIFIYNIKGEEIKHLSDFQNTGRIYWDIDNIASGVYIFMVKDKDGNKSFGKLGIIK